MAEKSYTPSDEEFQYDDSEMGNLFESSTTEKSSGGAGKVKRLLLILIALVVVVLATYKLLSAYFTPKQTTQIPPVQQTITPVTPVVTQPVQPVVTTPVTPSNTVTKLQGELTRLQTAYSNQQSTISALQGNISGLKTQMASMAEQLGNLNRRIAVLVQSMKPKKVKVVQRKPIRRPVKRRPIRPRTLYYVKALVPGRAWLMNKKGITTTVGKGDRVRGYGRVTGISPRLGRVYTSSGRVIRYSPSDS